jgi:hypothetical protein
MPMEDKQAPGGAGVPHAGQTGRRKLFAGWFTKLSIGGFFGLMAWLYLEVGHEPWVALLCAFCAGVAVGWLRGPGDVG